MPDEQDVRPMHFTRVTTVTVDVFPPAIEVSHDWLAAPHVYHSTIDGDVLTIRCGNGTGRYRLSDRQDARGVVASLIDAPTPAQLKRAARKFEGEA